MNADRAFGLDYVARRYHNGQGSRLYRILCRLKVSHRSTPSCKLLPRDEWAEARRFAAHYLALYRRHPEVFW